MVLTKNQILLFLHRLRRKQGGNQKRNAKGMALSLCIILVKKDIITVQDIIAEFPELDNIEEEQ